MKPPALQIWDIAKLHRYLIERRFAVPKLQRNFTWDPGRSAKLLDSIYNNMPIGSLFLWEMDKKSAHLIRKAGDILPSFSNSNQKIWFVIDGQQRLSVIYQAFEGQTKSNDSGRSIEFGRLCFLVKRDQNQENPQRIVYRKPVYRERISLCDILAPDWKRRMLSSSKAFLSTIKKCRKNLLEYPIPVVIVRSATLNDIGEVFIRVNSQGMRITTADRAIALMGKLDVHAMADELRHKVQEMLKLSGVDPILMGFNLISEPPALDGDPPKLEALARRWSKRIERNDKQREHFKKQWHEYQNAFLKAVDYLKNNFPVRNESFLPSENMLATLSVFFFHHRGQPNSYQRTEIRKWFWATGVAKRYSGAGYHRNLAGDAKFFETLSSGARRQFRISSRVDPHDLRVEEYSSGSARARAFLCLLASQRPRYLENAEPIPQNEVAAFANIQHRHHIFPKARLRKYFPLRDVNSLCNICFLVARENQEIGMRIPRSYLAEYRSLGRRNFARTMKSYLIPIGEESGIWESSIIRAFKQFRAERLSLICKSFEKEAGIKLFRNDN